MNRMLENDTILRYLVSEILKKHDLKTAECPFCEHVMRRHKIIPDFERKIVSKCEQCKAPCFEIASLQVARNEPQAE